MQTTVWVLGPWRLHHTDQVWWDEVEDIACKVQEKNDLVYIEGKKVLSSM